MGTIAEDKALPPAALTGLRAPETKNAAPEGSGRLPGLYRENARCGQFAAQRKKFAFSRSRQCCVSLDANRCLDSSNRRPRIATRLASRQRVGENPAECAFPTLAPDSTTSVAFLTVARNIAACLTRGRFGVSSSGSTGRGRLRDSADLKDFAPARRRSREARQTRGQICLGRMKGSSR